MRRSTPPKALPPLPEPERGRRSSPSSSSSLGSPRHVPLDLFSNTPGEVLVDAWKSPPALRAPEEEALEVAEKIEPTELAVVEMGALGSAQKGGYRRGIDPESLVLNLTPAGLVEHLLDGDGVDATDRWGWTALHKASIYGKSEHIIALLDAGADPSLRTEHDPTQIYTPQANALELAQCVDHEGWGDRVPIIKMLETAVGGKWQATRSDEERQKLKHHENIRLRQEQVERDIQMVAKGEALMRMKQRQEMEENLSAMAEAERRRDEALDREARAEQLLAEAEDARDAAQIKQADAEASQFALQARLSASRKEGESLGARVAELERALAAALEESRAVREELQDREQQWEEQAQKTASQHAAQMAAVQADLQTARSVADDLKEQLATRVRLHRLAVERAETAESKVLSLEARVEDADRKVAAQAEEIAGLLDAQEGLKTDLAATKLALTQETSAKDQALEKLRMEIAAREEQERKLADAIASHKAEVMELQAQLSDSRAETLTCQQAIEALNIKLASTKDLLEDERKNLARALREFGEQMETTRAEHAAQVARLEREIDQQKKLTETVSQQLAGKIRQLKKERARAEAAEGKIPPLVEEVGILKVVNGKLRVSLTLTKNSLAEEKAVIRELWADLHKQQNKGEYLVEKLAAEKFARAVAETKLNELRTKLDAREIELKGALDEVSILQGKVSSVEQSLRDQMNRLVQREAEWAKNRRILVAEHRDQIDALQGEVDKQKNTIETVSQQLVGKIRQYKTERARADSAERKISLQREEISRLGALRISLEKTLAEVAAALAAEQATVRDVRDELAAEQVAMAGVISELESERAARKEEELKVSSLQNDLQEARTRIAELEDHLETITSELTAVKDALVEEKRLSEQQLAELRETMARLADEHAAAVQSLERQVAHQKKEMETVSQQLVGKIRLLRLERERADTAEAAIPPLVEQLATMTTRYETAAADLEEAAAELAATKRRVAKLSLALDEERRTSSELRVTNLATRQRAERAEVCVEELTGHVARLEGELVDVRAENRHLEERVAVLQAELEALREDYARFREEALRLQQELERQLAERQRELVEARSILETKDDQGRTLLERLAASEERERMDAMRIELLNKQYSAMVSAFSDKDLLSSATPPASPLESPIRTPPRQA